ncbi:MAG TPA: hypothetical protein VF790_11695 [Dissulfurispiraceae bacterium]
MRKALFITLLVLFVAVNAMAITINISRSYRVGPDSVREGTIDFDASYPTNGEAVTHSDFNLSTSIRFVDIKNRTDASGNLKIFEYVPWVDASGNVYEASGNIKVYDASSNVKEVGNGTSLSNLTGVKFKVLGY